MPVDRLMQDIVSCETAHGPRVSLVQQQGVAKPRQRDEPVVRISFGMIQCTDEVRQPILSRLQVLHSGGGRGVVSRAFDLVLHRRKYHSDRVGSGIPVLFEPCISPLFSVAAMQMHFALREAWQYAQLVEKLR